MRQQWAVILALVIAVGGGRLSAQTADELLKKARVAFDGGQTKDALTLVGKAIDLEPKKIQGYQLRARMHENLEQHKDAVADYDRVIALKPDEADTYQQRGSAHFKLGLVAESVADFDRYLSLRPEKKPSHWQRGISCYYAGKFKEGHEQFESYQKYDDGDVENAIWHYLCLARAGGKDKARTALLKIREDKRIPMNEIYNLFAGKAKSEDVLTGAQAGKPTPEQLSRQLFYAHLYLGLYHESEGDAKKALHHLTLATDKYRVSHYMWDVARVHRDILKKK